MRTHLYVFAYDVQRDSRRRRLADLLSAHLTRAQLSLFEGHLAPAAARRLARAAEELLGPRDSLKVYAITAQGLAGSLALGRAPLPERTGFLLL